jgi:hypothetical protein
MMSWGRPALAERLFTLRLTEFSRAPPYPNRPTAMNAAAIHAYNELVDW